MLIKIHISDWLSQYQKKFSQHPGPGARKRKEQQRNAACCLLCLKKKTYYHLRDKFSTTIQRHHHSRHKDITLQHLNSSIVDCDDSRVRAAIDQTGWSCLPKKSKE